MFYVLIYGVRFWIIYTKIQLFKLILSVIMLPDWYNFYSNKDMLS